MAAHGTITSIDVDEARRAPGVVAVFTGDDLGDVSVMPLAVPLLNPLHAPPILAKDKVRFVGEPIAAIVAESPAAAADPAAPGLYRQSVVSGKSVSDLFVRGGRGLLNKK